MFSDIAVEIFERVEECRFEARKAVHAEDKGAWLALAEEWLRLADTPGKRSSAVLVPGRFDVS
jgi:hypothetical protein